MDLSSQMTSLSQEMFHLATAANLELSGAVAALNEHLVIRTVAHTLAHYCKIPTSNPKELQKFVVDKLHAILPQSDRDSIRRKVSLWMKEDALSITKQGAIQLCFALGLSAQEAETMLRLLCEEGLHWRDPEELCYAFALSRGMKYSEAVALAARIEASLKKKSLEGEPADSYTALVRQEVLALESEEELESYILENQAALGGYHNTAYELFMSFLSLLQSPEADYDQVFRNDRGQAIHEAESTLIDIKKYASREIINTYLYRRFVPIADRGKKSKDDDKKSVQSALQRAIKANWPDEITLSRMIHRETDVTRKTLLLLFLATDGGESAYANEVMEDLCPEEIFEDVYTRVCTMLSDCGFAPLDPRSQFDWMILYCLCAEDIEYFDGRIQRFLTEIFPESGECPDLSDGE